MGGKQGRPPGARLGILDALDAENGALRAEKPDNVKNWPGLDVAGRGSDPRDWYAVTPKRVPDRTCGQYRMRT